MHQNPIYIAIAEVYRFALKACLNKLSFNKEFLVTVTAFNGEELLTKIKRQPLDLVLMDIQMPGMDGIAATALLKQKYPEIKVLMLTTFDDDERIFNAILAGADGYLLKEETTEMLKQAIIETLSGGAAMSAGIASRVLNLLRNPLPPKPSEPSYYGLTKREIELLGFLKEGLSYDQIANKLFISYGTVRKHIENIYRKLQVNNKMSAIDVANKSNLL